MIVDRSLRSVLALLLQVVLPVLTKAVHEMEVFDASMKPPAGAVS